jgi:hypothetical protein
MFLVGDANTGSQLEWWWNDIVLPKHISSSRRWRHMDAEDGPSATCAGLRVANLIGEDWTPTGDGYASIGES